MVGFKATGITDALNRNDILEKKLKKISIDGGSILDDKQTEDDDVHDFIHLEEEEEDEEENELG